MLLSHFAFYTHLDKRILGGLCNEGLEFGRSHRDKHKRAHLYVVYVRVSLFVPSWLASSGRTRMTRKGLTLQLHRSVCVVYTR